MSNSPQLESAKAHNHRGPVEDIVAKRMKALGKKIQRVKTYVDAKPERLNADQRAAVASLPVLEGVHRELEELTKVIENVELEQAGKVRELRESARKEQEEHGVSKVAEFQASLSTPLSLFLRLHALLHPAPSSDHEHLTFARLSLPRNLSDEVQATDVLRVGRMHDDLVAGGERGAAVVKGLVEGPAEDEEDEHVHHLLKLVAESDSLPEDDATAEVEPEVAEPTEAANAAPDVVQLSTAAASEHDLPNGHGKVEKAEESADGVAAANGGGGAAGKMFNFLQADELEAPPAQSAQNQASAPAAAEPARSSAPAAPTPAPAPEPEAEPEPISAPAFDWAAEDDLDDETSRVLGLPTSSAPAAAAEDKPELKEEDPAAALIEENELANAHVSQPPAVDASIPAPEPVKNVSGGSASAGEGAETPAQAFGNGRGRGGKRGRGNRGGQQGQGQQRGPKPQGQQGQHQGRKIDDDGFQVVGSNVPGSGQAQVQGQGAGRGRGVGRGRGAGRGRGGLGGRGGARPAGEARTPPNAPARAPASKPTAV